MYFCTIIFSRESKYKSMRSPRDIFHIVSYLQYPLMIGAIYFYIPFIISLFNHQPDWNELNYVLIFFGIGLSFSTLQDTTKTQNRFSKRIWESPLKGKIALIIITILAFSMIILGLLIFYLSDQDMTENIAIGITVLGIGLIGILKAAIEMYENHRKDKNGTPNI